MKARERMSVLDKGRLRRRLSARIDHFLDRLVDIFDFPVDPPAYSQSVSAATTRKHSTSTGGFYSAMDGSPRTRARGSTSDGISKAHRVSMADRVRGLLRPSKSASASAKSKSMSVCKGSKRSTNVPEPRELRMSWFVDTNRISLKEPQDELWIECEEPDRQLECGYQYLADEATI